MTLEAFEKLPGSQKVLVVDDQPDVREALRLLLKGAGYAIETVDSPGEAVAAAANRDHDLIILDMNFTRDTTSGEEGLLLVDHLHAQRREVPIIAMTGWSTIELAVEAMHRGACDFIPKPWDNSHFLSVVRKHLNAAPDPFAAELAIARKVQRKLLPQPHFKAYGLSCECASLVAGEIGGDLYDSSKLTKEPWLSARRRQRQGNWGRSADGKSAGYHSRAADPGAGPVAIDAARERSVFRIHQARTFRHAVLWRLRSDLAHHPLCQLRTSLAGAGPVKRRFRIAGRQRDGAGAFKDRGFEGRLVAMQTGDRLVLFSDGFSEANMEAGDDWAVETIIALSKSNENGLANALASTAASGGKQADDITVMDLRVL